jgi:nucleoside-triphosphatase THEP1
MLILLSGPIGAGKTTLCERAAAAARERGVRVAGVLAPAVVEDGAKVGVEAVDLASGERQLLARTDRELGGMAALATDALVFVDEIGRLELHRGAGLASLIPRLIEPRQADTVVVVREDLLDRAVARMAPAAPRTVVLDTTSRDVAWAELEALLFRH